MAHEHLKIAQLPHPGFVLELLSEAKESLPGNRRRARIALEEVVEYLDSLMLEMRSLESVELCAFPRSPMEVRRNSLFKRMELWERREFSSQLCDWRLKYVSMNPMYRDLVIFMWAKESTTRTSYDTQKDYNNEEPRSRSVDLRTVWF